MGKFVVYQASAGSGKTYTLVQEYLKLALGDDSGMRFRQILAMTFTNKAASEMKERILSMLQTLSATQDSPLYNAREVQQKSTILIITPTELKKRAQKTLANILHNYADFSVLTIDKFIHRIVRSFARDLRLPVDFNIQMDTATIIQQAIDRLLEKVGEEPELTNTIMTFVEQMLDEDKSFNIENELGKNSRQITDDQSLPYMEQLKEISLADFKAIRLRLLKSQKHHEQTLLEKIKHIHSVLDKNQIFPEDLKGGTRSSAAKYFKQYASSTGKNITFSDAFLRNLKDQAWTKPSGSGKSKKDSIDSVTASLENEVNQLIQIYEEEGSVYNSRKILLDSFNSLAVLNELNRMTEEIKTENNELFISDFNRKIAGIVLEEPTPFIYERIGEKYHNYLLDEFQDTSVLQWRNILPLLENALANDHFNLIVGDGKQSIYRWRNGEVQQFVQLPKVFQSDDSPILKDYEQTLDRHYEAKNLEKNWRSKKEIIEFNNALFRHIQENNVEESTEIYKQLEQEFDENNTGGYIEITSKEKPEDGKVDWNIDLTLNKIQENIELGYQLQEIAILVHNKKHGQAIASALMNVNLPVVSSDSLLIASSPEVRFLVGYFTLLTDNNSPEGRKFIADYLYDDSNEESYFEFFQKLFGKKNISSEKAVNHVNQFSQHPLDIPFLKSRTIFEFTETLIHAFDLDKNCNVFVHFYLELVFKFQNKNKENSIRSFLNWWNIKKETASVSLPEGIEAIQILTIHKSKGLEFPVVIFPFAGDTNKSRFLSGWSLFNDPEAAPLHTAYVSFNDKSKGTYFETYAAEEKSKVKIDELNVLYVALTRASEKLYVFTCNPPRSKNQVYEWILGYTINRSTIDSSENHVFRIGEHIEKETKNTVQVNNDFIFDKVEHQGKKNDLSIAYQAPKHWSIANPNNKQSYGNALHRLLSLMHVESDLHRALDTLEAEGEINQDEREVYAEKLDELFTNEQFKSWFTDDWEVKNEKDIITKGEKDSRPDRVIINDNRTLVIDYKTTKKKNSEIERIKQEASHIQQITQYGNLLNEMGYTNIELYLVYTENTDIRNIPFMN